MISLDGPACMASVLLPPTDPAYLSEITIELVEHRVAETVRHRDGLSYVVEITILNDVPHPTGPAGHDLFVFADPPEEQLTRAVGVLVDELRKLLRHGPTESELSLAVERVVHRRRGREAVLEHTLTSGIDQLLGFERPPFDPAKTAAITLHEVQAYLRPLEASVLFALPDHPEVDLARLGLREDDGVPTTGGDLPEGRRYRAPLVARAISAAARQAELCLTADGLHTRLEGRIQRLYWSDVVGILVEGEHEAAVFGADGSHVQIGNAVWRDGDSLIRAARDRVPPHLIYRPSALLSRPDDL